MTAYATPIVDATEATLLDVDAKLATISTAIANILTQDTTTATKAEAIRALLAATLTVQGTVALDAASLAALESISVQNFPGDFPDAALLAKAEAIRALLAGTLGIAGTVAVTNFPATQPVSATSLPLPTGAATAANQATEIADLALLLADATFTGRVGELQNAPTAYTLLARLKTIGDNVATERTDLLAELVLILAALQGTLNFNMATALDKALDSVTAYPAKSSTGTPSPVAAAVADTLLLAANTNRRFASVFNDSAALLYLQLSSTAASPTSYWAQVPPLTLAVCPREYTGQIRGYWTSANGNARVTEI